MRLGKSIGICRTKLYFKVVGVRKSKPGCVGEQECDSSKGGLISASASVEGTVWLPMKEANALVHGEKSFHIHARQDPTIHLSYPLVYQAECFPGYDVMA